MAASAQTIPMVLACAPEAKSRTRISPAPPSSAPATVSRPGLLAVASPQPADDGDRGGVLDQQRNADLHVRNGVEVRELGTGNGDQPVGGDQAEIAAQHDHRPRS